MKTYRIGRATNADIVITDSSVSRDHADLIEAADGSYYWIDRNSPNGCFRCDNGQWGRLTKGYVAGDLPIRLGSFETTVAGLLAGRAPQPDKRRPPLVGDAGGMVGPLERDAFGVPRPKI